MFANIVVFASISASALHRKKNARYLSTVRGVGCGHPLLSPGSISITPPASTSTTITAPAARLHQRYRLTPARMFDVYSRSSDKCLVFSQWDDMLDIVELAFKENQVRYASERLFLERERESTHTILKQCIRTLASCLPRYANSVSRLCLQLIFRQHFVPQSISSPIA